jgi:hypothetical protein
MVCVMKFDTKQFDKEQQLVDIANQIATALQGIRFGSVEVVVHDSKVVQIERKEKLRFNNGGNA